LLSGTEMLYIDPETRIDCGACMDECPVDAIHYDEDLLENLLRFRELNAAYFERHPLKPDSTPPPKQQAPVAAGALRVDLEPDPEDDIETATKLAIVREYMQRATTPGNKRVVFRFHCAPSVFEGDGAITALRVTRTDTDADDELIATSLVLRSIGYRGEPLADLPFDHASGSEVRRNYSLRRERLRSEEALNHLSLGL
jgi:ferredoxin